MTRRKILIVDDEPDFSQMVKLNLESTGRYEVVMEQRGTKAFSTALQYRPDLILLDVIMPDKEGPDVLTQIRSHDETQNVPVVFLTATVTQEEVKSHNGRIGGHAFMAKPGTVGELLDCIEKEIELMHKMTNPS